MKELMNNVWYDAKIIIAYLLGVIGAGIAIPFGLVYRFGCWLCERGEKMYRSTGVDNSAEIMAEIADL